MRIDFHTHPVMIQELAQADPELEKNVREVFGLLFPPQPLEVFYREMAAAGIDRAVLLPIDCSSSHGCRIPSNEIVAELAAKDERLVGFASVDPHEKKCAERLVHAVREMGLKGLKLDPLLQGFRMDAADLLNPLFAACQELAVPVLVHCGLSWAPVEPARNGNPLDLEGAIRAFPKLNFILPHLGWPWINEALLLAMKYPNVYLDTSVLYSGTPAQCLRQVMGRNIGKHVFETNLLAKTVFGSNYPRVDMRRSVRGIEALNFSPAFLDNLFESTALKLLGGKS